MNKRKLMIVAFLLSCFSSFAVNVVMVSADGSKEQVQLNEIKDVDIVKGSDPSMTVNLKKGIAYEGMKTLILGDTTNSGGQSGEIVPVGMKSISIYPNPVSSYLTIVGVNEDVRTKVYDTKGHLVRSSFGSVVNVEGLPAGIYVLSVKGKFIRFIKE